MFKKNTKIELRSLAKTDMLQMVEEGIRWGISFNHRYAKAKTKFIKGYTKNKESSYCMYWNAKELYGWEMSQKLPLDNFERGKFMRVL